MKDVVTATEAKFRFGELLSRVCFGKQIIKIKKQKKTVAAVIPIEDLEDYNRLKATGKLRTRKELLEETMELVHKQKMLSPGAPDAVQIIRELRDSE